MKTSLLFAVFATAAVTMPASVAVSAPPSIAQLQQFAKCAADKYEGAELLATQPGSDEESEVLAEYGRRACSSPISDAGILRGVVAEHEVPDAEARERDHEHQGTAEVPPFPVHQATPFEGGRGGCCSRGGLRKQASEGLRSQPGRR